jgi:tetratricopeptide (TPR) repeat protein/tRNA A-37 threonylcarbamoyl transferase component Bud32
MPSSAPEDWTEKLFKRLQEHESRRESLGYGKASPTGGEANRLAGSDGLPEIPRYEILERLGQGATAIVYRARDRELHRQVALKVLRETTALSEVARQRFRRESQAAASLSHPRLITVYDAGEVQGRLYLVMELVEGRPLSALLSGKELGQEGLLRLIEQAARGVAVAHQKGIVHRDLKPGNIMVGPGGEPKVGDFGLAHLVDSSQELTRAGAALGTPLYMSPEQAEGHVGDISPRTDVYALGAMLYEIVTGSVPHAGETMAELYGKIIQGEVASPRRARPELSRDLETVMLKALEKDPRRRYSDAGDFADDLDRYLNGQPVRARPVPPLWRTLRKVAANRSLLGAMIAALVLLSLGFAWFLRSQSNLDRYHAAYQAGMESWTRAAGASRIDPAALAEVANGARIRFEEAGQALPQRPEPWLMIGRCRMLSGDGAGAIAAWDQALRRDPRFGPALFERGKFYLGSYAGLRTPPPARAGGGRVLFGGAEPESPQQKELRLQGEAALQEASAASGLAVPEQAYLRGALAYGKGAYPEAAAALETYAAANPWDARAFALLGNASYYSGDFAKAEAHLTQALRLDPQPRVSRARAYVRYSLRKYAEALVDIDECLRFEPENPEILCDRGLLLQALGRLDDAEKEYGRALDREPKMARALNNRGTVRAARRDFERASSDFEQAIFENPLSSEAYVNLGTVLVAQGKLDRAIQEFTTAVALDPGGAEPYANRGLALKLKGDAAGAFSDFQAAVEHDPRNPDARLHLAEALEERGNRPGAVKELREALRVADPAWPRRAAADALLQGWAKP